MACHAVWCVQEQARSRVASEELLECQAWAQQEQAGRKAAEDQLEQVCVCACALVFLLVCVYEVQLEQVCVCVRACALVFLFVCVYEVQLERVWGGGHTGAGGLDCCGARAWMCVSECWAGCTRAGTLFVKRANPCVSGAERWHPEVRAPGRRGWRACA